MIPRYFYRIFTGIFLLYHVNAYCQQLQFERFTTADGLPSDRVYTLHMDKKGYIWACTNYGIAKYNGNTFIPVCTNTSFKEHFAYCMYENEKGDLWYANSRSNIYKVKNDSAFKIEGIEHLTKELHEKAGDINNLFVDNDNNIFISSRINSYKITATGNQIINLNNFYKTDSADVIVLPNRKAPLLVKILPALSEKQKLYSYKIVKNNSVSEKLNLEIKNKNIVRLAAEFNNEFYFTAGNELIRVRKDGTQIRTTFQHFILMITFDQEGNIWAGLDQEGLYKINPEGRTLEHYFPETSVNCILFDDQAGLWVSTAGRGIFHCRSIHDYAFLDHPGLMESVGMAKHIDSLLFIGTFGGELFRIGKNGIPEKMDLKEMTKTMVGDIVATKDHYYIACKDAILKTDRSFKNIKQILNNDNKPASALSLEFDSKGNLFSLTRTNINKIENDRSIDLGRITSKTYDFINFEEGFLIATSNGLFLFSNDSIYIPDYLKPLEDVLITELKSEKGDIWICTVGRGLFCLHADHSITAFPDMPADVLHDVFFLNDTTMGLCLNKGVFITPLSKLRNIREWYQLNNEESATPVEYDNKLYLTTNSGLLSFSLENRRDKNNSKLYFTKTIAGDSTYAPAQLSFTHNQEKLEFYFDLLDYKTNKSRLFYTLAGRSSESGIVEGTIITLNKLPPGNYSLNVKPAISLLNIKREGTTINFTIEPAFWQTTWFIILVIILIIVLLIFIVYLINQHTKKKERQKAEVTRLLAEYKLTALKAQINPHFISNSLSAIQQLILNDKADKAAQYLSKFSLLIRYVLKYSDKAIVKLSEELGVIDLNIQLESLRFKDDFKIVKHIDSDIDPDEINIPPLITQPFIENAIWHGLLPLKGKRKPKLTINISRINSDVLISIEDNGVGRNPEKKVQIESKGTQLISNRLENINLMLGTKTAMLSIEDLFDTSGEASGTRIKIIIPGQLNTSEYDED